MTALEDVLVQLADLGLVGEVVDEDGPYILGGTKRHSHLGFNVYEYAFHLVPSRDGWEVTVAGPGQLDTVERAETITQALAALQRLLGAR